MAATRFCLKVLLLSLIIISLAIIETKNKNYVYLHDENINTDQGYANYKYISLEPQKITEVEVVFSKIAYSIESGSALSVLIANISSNGLVEINYSHIPNQAYQSDFYIYDQEISFSFFAIENWTEFIITNKLMNADNWNRSPLARCDFGLTYYKTYVRILDEKETQYLYEDGNCNSFFFTMFGKPQLWIESLYSSILYFIDVYRVARENNNQLILIVLIIPGGFLFGATLAKKLGRRK